VDDELARWRILGKAARREHDLLDLRCVRQHGHDDVGARCGFRDARRRLCALRGEIRDRLAAHVVRHDLVPGLDEVHRHRAAHDAEPDEADDRHPG
jgi:hypothetical protein